MRLCTICARGGSKGLPGKNTKLLLGEPLISWSIVQARRSGLFDYIVVSSDSDEILDLCETAIPLKRPAALATDKSSKIPVIIHAVDSIETLLNVQFETIVDLDVTSPLREPEDIIAATRLQEETKCSNVITGTPAHRSPYFNLIEIKDGVARLSKPSNITRRQDSPECYDMNASVYVWNRNTFMDDPKLFYEDTRLYVMPRERSVDIDDAMDFKIVEMILKERCLN